MTIALFFLSIFITILVIALVFILSTIRITVDEFNLSNNKVPIEIDSTNKIDIILKSIDIKAKLNVKLMFLNKIQIFKINLGNGKLSKIIKNKKIKEAIIKLESDAIRDKQNIEYLKYLKKLNIKTKKLKLNLELGTSDAIITSFLAAIIASGIGILLAKTIKRYNNKDYNYVITPIYTNKNVIKIGLFCIIEVKLVHIIHIIFLLLKKRRVDKYERTSNRRAYDYSYE